MSSRAKVAESVAKIRSIESSISGQRVVGLGGSTPAKPAAVRAASDFSAARIAEAFRNPQRIREAIIMAEVIGPPRGVR